MQLLSETRTAPARSILNTGSHLFWAAAPDDSLVKSIHEFGQVAPVLAQETENGLELIAGHARLEACRQLNELVLIHMCIASSDINKGLLYLTDNCQRTMDDGMRLKALQYFHTLMDEKALKADILPRLGIKPKSKDAKLLLTWLNLPETWQTHLANGYVPLAAGATLARMDDADRTAVEPLFSGFSWSRSNAVNILTWLFETSKMTTAPIAEVMQQAGLNDILTQGLSPKDTISRLTATAKVARYPEVSKLQDTFAKAASEITAGTKWRMTQPNNFETGGSELTIQVKDSAQLAQAVKDLETMAGLSPWTALWKLGSKND